MTTTLEFLDCLSAALKVLMNEYDVTFACLERDEIALDLHRSSGTSRFVKFRSVPDLRAFFSSLGFQEDRLTEIETVCGKLRAGEAYHETMLIPDSVKDSFDDLIADGVSNVRPEQAQAQAAL